MRRGDTEVKNVLESEYVCGHHFVSGRPSAAWDKHNVNWVPTLNLGKKEFKKGEEKDKKQKAVNERAERAKECRKRVIEQQQAKIIEKRKNLNQSGYRVADIPFSQASTSASSGDLENAGSAETMEMEQVEPSCSTTGSTNEATVESVDEPKEIAVASSNDAETQTEEFEYMFYMPTYRAPDREYFESDDKVHFYTGLLSYQVLIATLNHVAPHVSRRTQTLDPFQEFVMVLMKLRLNVSFQDLAYRFMVSVPTVSRIFWSWINAMDNRLSGLLHWPARENLWKTMPMCFKYVFGNKVTVVFDCSQVEW